MGLIKRDFDQIRVILHDISRKLRMKVKNNERHKIRHFNLL